MPEELIGNKYQLIEELGRGGFAIVYRANDVSLDREVAIKLLDPLVLERERDDPTFLPRFEREAKTMAGLQNSYIIDIYDYGAYKGRPYIVMPYLPGSSLYELIKEKGALDPAQVLRITEQVGSALDYAHQRGIVHRDIKPANVLFDEHGHAILTDFGIVKLLSEGTAMTKTGFGLGTPFYMAPEQWRGKEIDARSDLYALGIMVYEMLTGQVPFQGEAATIMFGHLEETPPTPQVLNPSLPAAVEPVLLKALAKDPELRYQKASQLTKDLKSALAGITVVKKRDVIRTGSSRRKMIGWIAGLLALLICGGSIATTVAGMNGSGPVAVLFATETPTPTNTSTFTPTPMPTSTNTTTPTPIPTDTVTLTPTQTPVPTSTSTPISTETPTPAPSPDTPTPPPPPPPTATSTPPGRLVGDSSGNFRSGPLAEGEWRYVWAESQGNNWWLPAVDGPEGCYASGHPNFDFAICQGTIRNNTPAEVAVQWKPLVDGDWLVEWDAREFRFWHRDKQIASQGPGPTLPNSVKLTELQRDWDDFFWAARTTEFSYQIRIYYLGIQE